MWLTLEHAWWVIGILIIFKIGIGFFLFRSQRKIRALEAQLNEEHESSDRLSRGIHESRALVARLELEKFDLTGKLDSMNHAVVELPLPPDLLSVGKNRVTYLPRAAYKGDGRVEVVIPGIYKYAYTLHIDPNEQTPREREQIYEALRNSREARAELGIAIS